MSQALLGRQIDGVWHTGIVAYGAEWYFGSGGISSCPPCGTILGQPDERKFQGRTHVSYDDFFSHITNLAQTTFKGSDYHLLNHNCNNFSDDVSEFLTGKKIPQHITGLPREVLSTPFGQMLMPMLEQMSVNPGANNPVDFNRSSAPAPSSSSSSNANSNASAGSVSPPSSASPGKLVSVSAASVEAAAKTLREEVPVDDRRAQLEEIKEFCLLSAADWSLGRPHLYLLADLASSSSTAAAAAAASDLLAAILSREEMVAMTTRDPKKTLQSLAASSVANDHSIRVFANLTRHPNQRRWFLNAQDALKGDATTTTPELTAYGVLTRHLERLMERSLSHQHAEHFAVLFYNTCLGLRELSNDPANAELVAGAALEMTTPILEFLVKLQSEAVAPSLSLCVETLTEAMDILVGVNEEAKELSKCYGIEADQIGPWAGKSKHLVQRIFS